MKLDERPPESVKPSPIQKKDRSWKIGAFAVGAGIGVLSLVLYLLTLAPGILPYDIPELPDAPMLQMQACTLSISHPTGYPTWTMLTHLFTYLPFDDCAYTVNLTSALYAALAASVVYAAGLVLTRRVAAAAVGGIAFGVSQTLWSQAVIAEVYTLNALFLALAFTALLLWRERRDERRGDFYLLFSAFLIGVCMTNHLTSGLLLPGGLLFVALVDWRKLIEWRLMLKAAGSFVLGLLPYAYLPIRASMGPPFEGNNPVDFESFKYVVSGGNLTSGFFTFGPSEIPGRVALYWREMIHNFHWSLLEVAVLGVIAMLMWDRAGAAFLGFTGLGWFVHAIENNIFDVQLYFIPTYVVISLWISCGANLLLVETGILSARYPRMPAKRILAVLVAALLILPFIGIRATYAENDMSEDTRARENIESIAEEVPRNATVLHHRSELWYMVLVEERRQDLTLVDPFPHNQEVPYADIVWPDQMENLNATDRRYGTDDLTGVKAAKMASRKGPVYMLAQEEAHPGLFLYRGFQLVHVGNGVYKLVPPGQIPPGQIPGR